MSTKTYCDICGKEMKESDRTKFNNIASETDDGLYKLKTVVWYKGDFADVCEQCADHLRSSIKMALLTLMNRTQPVVVRMPSEDIQKLEKLMEENKSARVDIPFNDQGLQEEQPKEKEPSEEPQEYPEDPRKVYTLKEVIAATGCDRTVAYNYIYRRREQFRLVTHGKGSAQKSHLMLTKEQYDKIMSDVRAITALRAMDGKIMSDVREASSQSALGTPVDGKPKRRRKPPKASGNWDIEGCTPIKEKEAWLRERVGSNIVFLRNGDQTTGHLTAVTSLTFDVVTQSGLQLTVITENTPLKALQPQG